MTMKRSQRIAAERIKESFARNVAAGGGGRGGKPEAVLRRARRDAELVACVFADYFRDLDKSFDAETFFRACCCLSETFIARMAERKALAERKAQP